MRVIVKDNYSEISKEAAEFVAEKIRKNLTLFWDLLQATHRWAIIIVDQDAGSNLSVEFASYG